MNILKPKYLKLEKSFVKNETLIVQFAGFLFFLILFLFALVFYKERMLTFDPAFFSFVMLDTQDYFIPLGRWGSVFSEFLPLLIMDGNSLKTFLQVYSVSYIFLYYILFLITTLILKNNKAGIAMMLALSLTFRHAFYYATAELYQAIAISLVLWAIVIKIIDYKKLYKKIISIIISLIIIVSLSYYHQLTLFMVGFVLGFELISKKNWKNYNLFILIGLTIIWYFIRIFVFKASDYESGRMLSGSDIIEYFPKILTLPSTEYFKSFFVQHFWSALLLGLATIFIILKNKKWLMSAFLIVYPIGFLIMILLTHFSGESPIAYENYYTFFGFFLAIPATIYLYNKQKMPIFIVISLIVMINLFGIFKSHDIFTKRLQYIDRLVEYGRKFPEKKYIIQKSTYQWQIAWVKWAFPFETLLYSSLDGPDKAVSFYIADDMNQMDNLMNKPNVFLGPDWAPSWFSSNNMNKNFINLPSTGYKKLSSSQDDTTFIEANFNTTNITIKPINETYYSDSDPFVVIPVKITNNSGMVLHSIKGKKNPVFITYHLYDKNGGEIGWDYKRTNFDVDIYEEYTQGVIVELPKKRGEYIVEIDFVTENIRWWGFNKRVKLIVR